MSSVHDAKTLTLSTARRFTSNFLSLIGERRRAFGVLIEKESRSHIRARWTPEEARELLREAEHVSRNGDLFNPRYLSSAISVREAVRRTAERARLRMWREAVRKDCPRQNEAHARELADWQVVVGPPASPETPELREVESSLEEASAVTGERADP